MNIEVMVIIGTKFVALAGSRDDVSEHVINFAESFTEHQALMYLEVYEREAMEVDSPSIDINLVGFFETVLDQDQDARVIRLQGKVDIDHITNFHDSELVTRIGDVTEDQLAAIFDNNAIEYNKEPPHVLH